ncbi:MAG TPA: sortase [Anaerolineales bacterium]|nr:sortase [Anaerolineales bacterium]
MNTRLVAFFRFFLFACLLMGSFLQPRAAYAASLPAEINKQFTPLQIDAGGVSVLRVTIFNPNSFQLTNAGWTDNLVSVQPGLFIATPAGVVNTCGGAVTATPGTTGLSLSGGTVPPQVGANPGECYVEINVSSVTSGNLINTIPANNLTSQGNDGGTIVNITNTTPASATITVIGVTPPSLSKGFSPNTIFVGEVSRLTITLNNNDSNTNLTGTSYMDTLPAGLVLAIPVNATVTGCGSGYALTAAAGTNTIAISNATVAPTPNCVVAVDVTGASGTFTNTIPAGPGAPGSVQTDQGVTNNTPASSNLNVQPVDIDKSFSPAEFQAGGTTTLTITLENPTGTAYTNINFSDTLPGVFVIASPAIVTNSCGGTLTAASGTQLISLSGGTIPASITPPTPVGSCVITVQVTAPAGSSTSSSTNTIPAGNLNSPDHPGLTNITAATATVSTYSTGTGLNGVKSFNPSTIDPGGNTRLRIDLTAPADTNLTNFSITDNLPPGVTISNSTPATKSANCIGGSLNAPTGGVTISWTGGTINAGTMCRIDVYVTSSTSGTVTNTIQPINITNSENRRPANDITDDLTVRTISDLTVSKAFSPNQVVPAGISTLTITLQNTNALPLVNVSALDDLTTMGTGGNAVRVAPTPNASTTCGGTVTANAGASSISLSGGTVPAQVGGVPGICTISVDILAQSNTNTRTNTIPSTNVTGEIQGTGTTINAMSNATATLQTLNLTIGVVKGFNPVLVHGGASSTLSVQLINPNTTTLLGIAFTDDMTLLGTGIEIANPPNLNVGTCGGTLTGNTGDTSFSFSGGILAPNTSCTLTLSVIMLVNGNLTNRIPAGAVTTFNGVSNPDPTEASLTNLPGVSINKSFTPGQVSSNQPSTLTITIRNTSNVPVVNMGLADNLPGTLPDGLEIANPANATNTCGGTLTTAPGSQTVQLTGGGLAALGSPGDSCVVSVDVLSTRPGVYINTIPRGALTADGGITNNDAASATLAVNQVNQGTYSLGNRVWYDTDNSGTINGLEVGVDGVTVQLYAADASGNPIGAALGTQTTANGGYYRFDNLPAGDYVVVIPGSQFGSGGVLAGYWSSGTTVSGAGVVSETAAPDPDNDVDSDDNGTRQAGGTFANAVISGAVTLGPGSNEPTNDADADPTNPAGEASDAQSNRTVDFGFYRGQLGNLVFVDVNGNGTYDAGDTTLSGATVQLFASDGTTEINVGPDGVFGTADDAAGGVTTGAGGTYLFSGLPAGDYIVRVTPPPGYVSTVDTASPADSTSPNANTDNNDNGVGTAGGVVSSNVVALTPGSTGALNNTIVTQSSGTTYNPTLDFGFLQQNTLVADPALAKAGEPSDATVGDTVTFTLTVTNTGSVPAPNVVVTDELPAMFDVTAVTVSGAPGLTLVNVTPPIGVGPAPYTVVVTLNDPLAATDVVTISITTTVNSLGNPPLINLARLTTSAPTDAVPNNSASVTLTLRAPNPRSNPRSSAVSNQALLLPVTGFAPDVETKLPVQPHDLLYAATDVMLEIPSLGVKIPIVGVPKKNGTWDASWLGRQAGWLEGSAFPSWSGNSLLTSHVYDSNGLPGPFVNLYKLKYGDQIIVHAYGQKYLFEVQSNQVVAPNDTSAFKHEEKSWLTLITCKEYDEKTDSYRKRVIVRAVLVKVQWER